ncbi:MAG: 50S ribosomal protein L29 [bacterium]
MNIKELRLKTKPEIQKMLAELREELSRLRFSDAAASLKKVRSIRETKKTIARILTILNKKD